MAAYEDIKGGDQQPLERSSTQHTDEMDEKAELSKEKTLSKIDVENRQAYKGDDSDGEVEWRFRNIMASIFLCMLYTGEAGH